MRDMRTLAGGIGILLCTGMVCLVGARTAISAMDRNVSETISRMEQQHNQAMAEIDSMKSFQAHGFSSEAADAASMSHAGDTFLTGNRVSEVDPTNDTPVLTEPWWTGNPYVDRDENGVLFHVVESGDTFSDIASNTGFGIPELASYNGISDLSEIREGVRIEFPADGPSDIGDPQAGLG